MKDRHERFIQEYLVDMNAAAAARRVGYASDYGWQLLRLPEVRRAVETALEEKRRNAVIRQEDVLRELGVIAMGEASDVSGAALKVASKLRALELLGKHLGMFEGRGGSLEQVVIVEDVGEDTR